MHFDDTVWGFGPAAAECAAGMAALSRKMRRLKRRRMTKAARRRAARQSHNAKRSSGRWSRVPSSAVSA